MINQVYLFHDEVKDTYSVTFLPHNARKGRNFGTLGTTWETIYKPTLAGSVLASKIDEVIENHNGGEFTTMGTEGAVIWSVNS